MNILFVHVTSKKDVNNIAPIYCRITIDKKRSQFLTNLSCKKEHWNAKKQEVRPKTPNSEHINLTLSKIKIRLQQIYLEAESDKCTSEYIKSVMIVNTQKIKKKTVFEVIAQFLDNKQMLVGKNKQNGGITQESFNVSKRILENFKKYLKNDCSLDAINQECFDKYHEWLTAQNWTQNYNIKCLQAVKTIMNFAGYHHFENTQLPKKNTISLIYLTTEEKERLENYVFVAEKLQKVQDLFLFQCYTGLAYVDMCNFSEKHIFKNNDKLFIKMNRQKTNQETIVPFLPQAQAIYEKNEGKLPIISNQNYNSYLKEIAGILGIDKKLTTHVARKTFATLSLNAGISIESVSKCLGHSSIKITQQVYAKINETRILREFDNINF